MGQAMEPMEWSWCAQVRLHRRGDRFAVCLLLRGGWVRVTAGRVAGLDVGAN